MHTVNISTLKDQLSAILQKVKKGEEVWVTDRHQPIAKITPITSLDYGKDEQSHLDELERKGLITKAIKKISPRWFEENPPIDIGEVNAVAALLAEREESRY